MQRYQLPETKEPIVNTVSASSDSEASKKIILKTLWGRECKKELDHADDIDDDAVRIGRLKQVRIDETLTLDFYCTIAIDNDREEELLNLIDDAQKLDIHYSCLNQSSSVFSDSPLDKICKSPKLLESVSKLLHICPDKLLSLRRPKEMSVIEREELLNEFLLNLNNVRPPRYSLEEVLTRASIFNIDLRSVRDAQGLNAIQILCYRPYTPEKRLNTYDLLSKYGIKLNNTMEAYQLVKFLSTTHREAGIEYALMLCKHASLVIEASLIQECILNICESAKLRILKGQYIIPAISSMLDYIKEQAGVSKDFLQPIIHFCVKYQFPKDVLELLLKYPEFMTSVDTDIVNKKIAELVALSLPGRLKSEVVLTERRHESKASYSSHSSLSFVRGMAEKSRQDKVVEKQINELLTPMIKEKLGKALSTLLEMSEESKVSLSLTRSL